MAIGALGGDLYRTDGNIDRQPCVLVWKSRLGVYGARPILSDSHVDRVRPLDSNNLPRREAVVD